MSSNELLAAPVLPALPEDKWRREQQAFHMLLPERLGTHRGQFVAIHEGRVVESGADKLDVARCSYARFGYVPIFVSRVTDRPLTAIRIRSPRRVGNGDSA
ncbi:MAG: hypothetical protein ACHRXM_20420 [Isosphaerales bacterium]